MLHWMRSLIALFGKLIESLLHDPLAVLLFQ